MKYDLCTTHSSTKPRYATHEAAQDRANQMKVRHSGNFNVYSCGNHFHIYDKTKSRRSLSYHSNKNEPQLETMISRLKKKYNNPQD